MGVPKLVWSCIGSLLVCNKAALVCNRGDTIQYHDRLQTRSQAKPLYYIVFLIPRLALSSHQHRNLVCPAAPQGVRLYLAKQNMAAAAAAARRTAMKVLPSPALLLSILVKRLYCAHSPTNPTTACQEGFQLLHTMQNSFFKWTKLLDFEMTIFGLK